MALAGPRLDRPSAIGEEGRPRTVSLWIATAVVLAAIGLAGVAIGQPSLVLELAGSVGLTVAGIALVERERFGPQLVGYVAFVLFGAVLVLTIGIASLSGPYGLALAGAAVALFGIGTAWADAGSRKAMTHTSVGTLVAYVVFLITLGLLSVVAVVLLAGGVVLAATTEELSPGPSVVWFVLVVGYAAAGLRIALWALPLEQLLSRRRRPTVRRYLDVLRRGTLVTAVAAVLALLFAVLLVAVGAFATLGERVPAAAVALDALAAGPLLGTLGTIGTVAVLASLVAAVARLATRTFDPRTARWVAPGGAGVVLALLLVATVAFAMVLPSIRTFATALSALAALLFLPGVLIGLTFFAAVGMYLGLVPDRAGGPAVAAAGMVVAAIGFGHTSPPVVFACVAAAAVTWDASWYGLGLTAELGHIPETRRLELFHGVVVLAVGLVAVLALAGLESLRSSALAGVGNTVALYVAGVGIVLLLLPLRG